MVLVRSFVLPVVVGPVLFSPLLSCLPSFLFSLAVLRSFLSLVWLVVLVGVWLVGLIGLVGLVGFVGGLVCWLVGWLGLGSWVGWLDLRSWVLGWLLFAFFLPSLLSFLRCAAGKKTDEFVIDEGKVVLLFVAGKLLVKIDGEARMEVGVGNTILLHNETQSGLCFLFGWLFGLIGWWVLWGCTQLFV